ncbi:MAG: cyanophycinase [Candidatus Aminicenantes bacterium]|nr:cyanophycinase [Candidatus Aminicenantes bacterium]MDH5385726.1 cyanophycinase [Candidatus Aminicenantes bacterium]MDH5744620.1 cyanophycinase [Candidatus Aminicenantes bacterium]
MRKTVFILLCLSLLLSSPLHSLKNAEGYLFIIGGGHRTEAMMKRFLELGAQSSNGKLVIFPMASSQPVKAGQSMVEEFKNLGVQDVEYHVLNREQALREENVKILDNVSHVYFSGGDQSRLTTALVNTPIHRRLLEIYKKGGVIGGTSAGAAVMSELMITGDEKRNVEEGQAFEKIQADNIVTTPGFGFIKTAIIDQHFVARKRHNRLISLVAEHPDLLGIGIDESTAIIVKPDEAIEVIGEQNVVVYDATKAKINILPSHTLSGFHIIMHLLKPGDKFDLRANKPAEQDTRGRE